MRSIEAVGAGEVIFGPGIADRVMAYFRAVRARPSADVFPELTDRERVVLGLIAEGQENAEIAAQLCLSVKTVRNHASNIFAKLQVAHRAQAIMLAREAGLSGRGPGASYRVAAAVEAGVLPGVVAERLRWAVSGSASGGPRLRSSKGSPSMTHVGLPAGFYQGSRLGEAVELGRGEDVRLEAAEGRQGPRVSRHGSSACAASSWGRMPSISCLVVGGAGEVAARRATLRLREKSRACRGSNSLVPLVDRKRRTSSVVEPAAGGSRRLHLVRRPWPGSLRSLPPTRSRG